MSTDTPDTDTSDVLRDNNALETVKGKTIETIDQQTETVTIHFEDGSELKIDAIGAYGIVPVWRSENTDNALR